MMGYSNSGTALGVPRHGFLRNTETPYQAVALPNPSIYNGSRGHKDIRMYEVTVEDSFAAGHYLRNYKGRCENPHGHNYKVRVTLRGAELDKAGLLLDFKDLKEVMKHVIDRLDHQMLNEIDPFTALNPSAENLAKYFYDEASARLKSLTTGRVAVRDVTIWETDSTTARYSE
jgi:6-pyruvoyltetrahydropterin/6-carboxytetrahydropterin synthase